MKFKRLLNFLYAITSFVKYGENRVDLVNHVRNTMQSMVFETKARILRLSPLKELETSKLIGRTAFVLGAGESIADLTDEEWEHIEKTGFIVGVNLSIIHNVKPDIVFWEPLEHEYLNDLFIKSAFEKLNETKVIVNSNHLFGTKYHLSKNFLEYKKVAKLYSYAPYKLKVNEPEISSFEYLYNKLQTKNIIHHCTHIGAAVDYCFKNGARNVVLLGCDLNGGKYFSEVDSKSEKYNRNGYYEAYNSFRRELVDNIYRGQEPGVHSSMNKANTNKNKSLTAYDYFLSMNSSYKRQGLNLYVYNSSSSLSKFLPIFKH